MVRVALVTLSRYVKTKLPTSWVATRFPSPGSRTFYINKTKLATPFLVGAIVKSLLRKSTFSIYHSEPLFSQRLTCISPRRLFADTFNSTHWEHPIQTDHTKA